MANKVNDNYAVVLKSKKLPLALLQDEDKARDASGSSASTPCP